MPDRIDNPVATLAATIRDADPTYHGWRLMEDTIGADPYLLCEWIRDGAYRSGPVYQIDYGEHTAWGYRSLTHGGWLAADTTDDTPCLYQGAMGSITRLVIARLIGHAPNLLWLFDDRPVEVRNGCHFV